MRLFFAAALLAATPAFADQEACKAAGGVWTSNPDEDGCTVAGKKEGVWHDFYPSGAIAKEYTYTGGKKNGPARTFARTCLRATEGTYADDKEDGKWTYYDREGRKLAEGDWVKGVKQGTWASFFEGQK